MNKQTVSQEFISTPSTQSTHQEYAQLQVTSTTTAGAWAVFIFAANQSDESYEEEFGQLPSADCNWQLGLYEDSFMAGHQGLKFRNRHNFAQSRSSHLKGLAHRSSFIRLILQSPFFMQ